MTVEADILEILSAEGFLPAGVSPTLARLAGGVSSEVFRMDLAGGPVCVKQALAKLRVAADWRAPVERSRFEVAWLRTARAFTDRVPEVLFEAVNANLFVMAFFDPATHTVWKADLAAGRVDPRMADRLGRMIAAIHAGAAGSGDISARFDNTPFFEDLRLSPFLRFTAGAHPDLAEKLTALADRTAATRITLVHGDVSPKNILCGPDGPILLDAECAWYGDPAFDLAFCSTHLLLKAVWKPQHTAAYLSTFAALQAAYLGGVAWESPPGLEARAAELTGALLLARVDGKSPVEYLQTEADRNFVRHTARALIADPPHRMTDLSLRWKNALDAR